MKLADAVEGPEEKPVDPHVALEKLIRLDRKHTNFDFVDTTHNVHFKVQYPSAFNDAPSNDHLLRQFWRHVHNYYFRPLEEPEIGRLDYFASVLDSKMSDELPFRANNAFWKSLQGIFNPTYLQKQIKAAPEDLDSQNWLSTIYLYNHLLDNQEGKSQKKLIKDFNDLKLAKGHLEPSSHQKKHKDSLKYENQALKSLLPESQFYENYVDQQIKRLTEQLQSKHERTLQLFEHLSERVRHEQIQKKMIYCLAEEEQEIQINEQVQDKDDITLWERINQVDIQKRYLESCIKKLQKKQVAESLSKILKVEKSKGEYKYVITFQQAMNVKKKIITEQQLLELNKIREYSLFKFYNTSVKSPYSFICQNFLGFREIYTNRNKPCKYKNKNILEQIKKSSTESHDSSKGFQKFDICHHCKLLYPENFLIKCRYSSQKLGIPIQPPPFVDPYITQISKIETSPSERYMIRRRNCYQNYTKNGDQYCCNRKFCKYCLRQNYDDTLDKNGLCPFCQGTCFCTRCARNEMIVRLRSMYLLLGGQVSKLPSEKVLEIEGTQTDEEETTSVRKKGRPKKIIRRSVGSNAQEGERLNNIRVDLESLRLLCHLVKKREKIKLKNLEKEQQIFEQKVKMFSKDTKYSFSFTVNKSSRQTMSDEIQNHLSNALQKKLKRMI